LAWGRGRLWASFLWIRAHGQFLDRVLGAQRRHEQDVAPKESSATVTEKYFVELRYSEVDSVLLPGEIARDFETDYAVELLLRLLPNISFAVWRLIADDKPLDYLAFRMIVRLHRELLANFGQVQKPLHKVHHGAQFGASAIEQREILFHAYACYFHPGHPD
jgi:hypothetical protein